MVYLYHLFIHTHTHTHAHNRSCSAIKKNKIMTFVATWMDLKIIILTEVGQKEKDKYHITSLTCGI